MKFEPGFDVISLRDQSNLSEVIGTVDFNDQPVGPATREEVRYKFQAEFSKDDQKDLISDNLSCMSHT